MLSPCGGANAPAPPTRARVVSCLPGSYRNGPRGPSGGAGPRLAAYIEFLRHLLTRDFQPLRRVAIETINAAAAADSGYVDALRELFDANLDYKRVILYRKVAQY